MNRVFVFFVFCTAPKEVSVRLMPRLTRASLAWSPFINLSLGVTFRPVTRRLVVRFAFVQELLCDGTNQRVVLRERK